MNPNKDAVLRLAYLYDEYNRLKEREKFIFQRIDEIVEYEVERGATYTDIIFEVHRELQKRGVTNEDW